MEILPVSSDYDPHLEFRTLSMLFTAVSTINRGQPSQPSRPYDEKYYTKAERYSRRELALNAVATILVRNTEVVAVVDHGPSQHDGYHIYAMPDGERADTMQNEDKSSLRSKISALANPIRKRSNPNTTKRSKKQRKPLYVIAEPGQSHYHLISGLHWNCLKINSDNDPLENHLATVVDFLQKCRKVDRDGAAELLHTFHRYTVASSWRKMHRRITHCYSRAMFSSLRALTPQNMQIFFERFASKLTPSSRQDSAFTATLVDLEEQGLLQEFVDVPLAEYPDLDHADAKVLVHELRAASESQNQQGLGAYNERTCFVFHLLLIATISGFRYHLQSLAEGHSREYDAQQVLQFGRLLWRIGYSQMLTYHLRLLEAAEHLHTPPSGNHLSTPPSDNILFAKHEECDSSDDDEDDTAEDVEFGGPDNARTSAAQKFRRWIQLLIGHWAALEQLSGFNSAENAQISLIRVRPAHQRGAMEPWEFTIRKLAALPAVDEPAGSFDAETAINVFKNNIQSPEFDAKVVQAFRRRLKDNTFEALRSNEVVFCGNIHGEVALALADKHNEEDALLQRYTTDINYTSIAVSKLCCHACWEFLKMYRGTEKMFKVRGCHGTVSTVDLPPSVPPEILKGMVELFRTLLRRELIIMVGGGNPGPDRTSMESESSLSTASHVSSSLIVRRADWAPIRKFKTYSK